MSAHSPDEEIGRLLQLSEEVTRIAGALASLSLGARGDDPALGAAPSIGSVEFFIRARRERARYFPADLFAEPAWDMMLELLRSDIAGERVSEADLCLAAGVPNSTALRWITNMVARGLLIQEPDPHGSKTVFIKLGAEMGAAMRRYFAEIIKAA